MNSSVVQLRTLAFTVLMLCISAASMADQAVSEPIVATFDPQGTQADHWLPDFTPVDIYVIGKGIGEVVGWELSVEIDPPGLTVLDRVINNGPGVNPLGDDDYILGLGGCFGTLGEDYLFVTYTIGQFGGAPDFEDGSFCLHPANGGEPPAAGFIMYVDCENQTRELHARHYHCGWYDRDHCALLNSTILCGDNEKSSWGAVKARY